MARSAPKIDTRRYNEIAADTERLAKSFTEWQPRGDGKPDAGSTLIRIFARMAEVLIDRLNQVPDKQFLAFLDMIGARVQPPRAARVPLTFTLATGARDGGFVPARTQVATSPAITGEEIVFETERDLVLTSAQLIATVAHDPTTDRYTDASAIAIGSENDSFSALAGEDAIEHSLYIANDDMFTLPGKKDITLTIETSGTHAFATLPISWWYWNGTDWQTLSVKTNPTNPRVATFENPPIPAPLTLHGRTARWIRATYHGIPPSENAPTIQKITISASIDAETKIALDQAFANTVPLDLSSDIMPFGQRPAVGDTLYLLNNAVFARRGAVVKLNVTRSPASKVNTEGNPKLEWEMWNGSSWANVDPNSSTSGNSDELKDDTADLTNTDPKTLTFTVPNLVKAHVVNGVLGYWLRARLASGNYGIEPSYKVVTDEQGKVERRKPDGTKDPNGTAMLVEFVASPGFAPPIISSIVLSYTYTQTQAPTACLTFNNFRFADVSGEAPFTPFVRTRETQPALYLGFDQPFANRPNQLYLQVEPALFDEAAKRDGQTEPAQVVWEYAAPPELSGGLPHWKRLGAQDETRSFNERGMVVFIGTNDMFKHANFGHDLFWLRARLERGSFAQQPRLRRVRTNTGWASQTTSVMNEVLGSSDASQNQIFQTILAPVLLGQQISVHEPNMPTTHEQTAIMAIHGSEAITPHFNGVDQTQGVWMRWQEVPDFYASTPLDRHYVFDHITGEVRFGDGQYGMIPPLGRDNIVARYQSGGGARGNIPAGSISQLKSAVAYVDSVTNGEPAAGGADQEALERVKEHGPHRLRHNNRSVAGQDYQDLALEASPEVARALVIMPLFRPLDRGQEQWVDGTDDKPNHDRAGQVDVIIVPYTTGAQPVPSLELIHVVETFLRDRCPATVDLRVAGPAWTQVTVSAQIVPTSVDAAGALTPFVEAALRRFLHPLHGGQDGRGWAFGRRPHQSDLYAMIEGLPGVEYVHALEVRENPSDRVSDQQARMLIYSGDHDIRLVAG